jgi:hypothetical protein
MAVPGWLLGVITWASAGHPMSAGRSWLEVLVFAVFSLGIIAAQLADVFRAFAAAASSIVELIIEGLWVAYMGFRKWARSR